jgi:tetratricopeptide (TPR) repeat protein
MNNQSSDKIKFFSRNECPVLLLVVIGLLVYANSFAGPFIFDDTSAIEDNPYIKNLRPLSEAMSAPSQSAAAGRPIVALTLAINYAVSGYSVWSYHLFNLLIHILAALTLYGIIRRTLLSNRLKTRFANKAIPLAWATAAIWLVHPIQTESVTYIIKRNESLMGLFYLLTLYTAIRAMHSRHPIIIYALSVACCGLGMATKEVMATAPVMVLLYDRTFCAGSVKRTLQLRWLFYAGLAATWGILFTLISTGPRSNTTGFGIEISPINYALSQFGVVLHYLRICLWPVGLCIDLNWPFAKTWVDIIPPMLVVAPLLAVTLWGLLRNRSWSYPLVWLFGILSPTSSFIPIAFLAFEYRMYLPLAGFVVLFLLAGYVLMGKTASKLFSSSSITGHRIGIAVVIVLIIALGFTTIRRNRDFRSAEAIWQTVIDIAPNNPRAHANLGIALKSKNKLDEALDCFYQALRIAPDYVKALNNIGLLMEVRGKPNEAISHYRQALKIKPDYAEAHHTMQT